MAAFTNKPKTSGSFISGVPAFARLFEFYDENYMSMVTKAMDEVMADYEKQVRNHARATWGDLADTISIQFDPSSFEVTFTASAEAEALEYGDGNTAPTAVLRNAAIEASQQLPAKIIAKMSGKL